MTHVVRMTRVVLNNDPHDSSYKLNVGCKRAKWPKDGCNTELWMIEALAQHLDLNDAVQCAIAQIGKYRFLLLRSLFAMYDGGVKTSFLVERTDLICVID